MGEVCKARLRVSSDPLVLTPALPLTSRSWTSPLTPKPVMKLLIAFASTKKARELEKWLIS